MRIEESVTSSASDGVEGGGACRADDGSPLAGLRVLVVDDDPQVRTVVALMLARAGAVVAPADSAATARALWQAEPPDLLVSDIEMPGENGFSFMRRIREAGSVIAAIAISGSAIEDVEALARAAGFSDCLSKPFRPETLVALAAKLLDQGRAVGRGAKV